MAKTDRQSDSESAATTAEATATAEVLPTGIDPVEPGKTQAGDDYSSRGGVVLATPYGHEFRPSNKDLPPITHRGVNMTREQADAVLAESKEAHGNVLEVIKQEGE